MEDVIVSIVIVCMNNLDNLYPCLGSIRKHNKSINYETFVVAYLFTEENLLRAKKDFPWVIFIESNEIRGFSENNNLALRQAKGKYCLVLNDDTEMVDSLIEKLVDSFEQLPNNVAIVSPPTYYKDGTIQSCGKPPVTTLKYALALFGMWNGQDAKSKYTYQKGLFKTYNIIGAAFLIKTSIFKSLGWFDEKYFFSPEDLALSTTLNKMGYSCYVNADLKLIHYEGKTRKVSLLYAAIKPATLKGNLIFFSHGKTTLFWLLALLNLIRTVPSSLYHGIKYLFNHKKVEYALMKGHYNCIEACITKKTPKELFVKFYKEIK